MVGQPHREDARRTRRKNERTKGSRRTEKKKQRKKERKKDEEPGWRESKGQRKEVEVEEGGETRRKRARVGYNSASAAPKLVSRGVEGGGTGGGRGRRRKRSRARARFGCSFRVMMPDGLVYSRRAGGCHLHDGFIPVDEKGPLSRVQFSLRRDVTLGSTSGRYLRLPRGPELQLLRMRAALTLSCLGFC